MGYSGCFVSFLGENVFWSHLQKILLKYEPELAEKYIAVTDALSNADEDVQALVQAYQAAITSDALFAFSKGMEANLYHFRNPCAPKFTQTDFSDLYQERVMRSMPKRKEAELQIAAMEEECGQTKNALVEVCREFFVDLEVIIPKIMHFEGYLAANDWFRLTIPGYIDDPALTKIYQAQISNYFGL